MVFPWLAITICCSGDIVGLKSAGRDCSTCAENVTQLAGTARDRGETAVEYSREVKEVLQSFGKVNAETFVKIKGLVEGDRVRKTLDIATEMDDLAKQCITQATGMTESMQRGIDSLPEQVKQELEQEQGNNTRSLEDDDEAALNKLLSVDSDIEEIETNTRSVDDLNIFTASVRGREVFESVAMKQTICKDIFERIKGLAASIAGIAKALAGSGTCCEEAQAIAAGVVEMFKCIRLSNLIKKAAEAASKLIKAIISFVKTAWDKFGGFIGEFEAAKRLGRFVSKYNPLKVGQNILGSLGGGDGGGEDLGWKSR